MSVETSRNRQYLDIVRLSCTLDGVTLVPTTRKPFDLIAQRLVPTETRADRTRTCDLWLPKYRREPQHPDYGPENAGFHCILCIACARFRRVARRAARYVRNPHRQTRRDRSSRHAPEIRDRGAASCRPSSLPVPQCHGRVGRVRRRRAGSSVCHPRLLRATFEDMPTKTRAGRPAPNC